MKRKLIYESPSLEDLESLLKIVCSEGGISNPIGDESSEIDDKELAD